MPIHLVLSFGSTEFSILATVCAKQQTKYILHAGLNHLCLFCDKSLTSILLMFLFVYNWFLSVFNIFQRTIFVKCHNSGIKTMLVLLFKIALDVFPHQVYIADSREEKT